MAGLDDKSRLRDHVSIDLMDKLMATLDEFNRTKAEMEAVESEIQDTMNELERFDNVTVTDKDEIDTVALLIKERQWEGTITIVDFEDSIHLLQQYAHQMGIPINEVVPRHRA